MAEKKGKENIFSPVEGTIFFLIENEIHIRGSK
jgi:hypothetical protein